MSGRWRPGRLGRSGALLGALAATFLAASIALGSFNSSTSASNTVSTKRIFSGARTTSAYTFQDLSAGGAGTNADLALAYADAVIKITGNWSSSFSSTRYLEFDLNAPQPGGLSLSSPTFDFRMIPNAGGETACYYFEVRKASDGSILGTHGSTGSPVACITGSTYSTTSTAISEVTGSNVSNDLRIRVFVKESNSKPIKIDMATVSATAFSAFTLHSKIYRDASAGGAPTVTTWELETAGDGAQYTTVSNWTTSFTTTRYLQLTYPAYLPTGAVITAATFTHSYKGANSGDTACYYFEVYSSTTLLATHGSSGSPVSCNATTSFVTDTTSIAEVDTVAKANSIVIKLYVKNSGTHTTIDDVDTVTITYSLV